MTKRDPNSWIHVHSAYPGVLVRIGRSRGQPEERLDITVTLNEDEARELHRQLAELIEDRDEAAREAALPDEGDAE